MSIATVRVLDVSKLSEMRAWTKYYNIARLMAFAGSPLLAILTLGLVLD